MTSHGPSPGAGAARDEVPADPHLEAALRHAPDTDAAVPPLVRARVVAAARRSAEASRARQPWWRRWAAAGTPAWRMGGAGTAVAAVLAATVLWVGRDEWPQDRAAESSAPVASSPVPASVPAPASPAPPAAATGSSTAPATAPATSPADPPSASRTMSPAARSESANANRLSPPAAAARGERPSEMGAARESADAAARQARAARSEQRAQSESRSTDRARAEAQADTEAALRTAQVAGAVGPGAAGQAAQATAAAPAGGASPTAAPAMPVRRAAPDAPAAVTAAPHPTPFPAQAVPQPAPQPPAAPPPPPPASPPAPAAAIPPSPAPALRDRAAALRATAPADTARTTAAEPTSIVDRWSARADLAAWRVRAPEGAEGALPAAWPAQLAARTRGRWQIAAATAASSGEVWALLDAAGVVQARLLWSPGALQVCEANTGRCEQTTFVPPTPNPMASQMATDQMLLEALRNAVRR